MPGLWGIVSEKEIQRGNTNLTDVFHRESSVSYITDYIHFPRAALGRFSINKFAADKVFSQFQGNVIATEGVILNSSTLLNKSNTKTIAELIFALYSKNGWRFASDFTGGFSGFVYDINKNNLTVFTDHFALKTLYYFFDEKSGTLIFASELKVVVKGMRELGFTPNLSIQGAYSLLTMGFMLGDMTLAEGIKKLMPGHVLQYSNGNITLKEYYRLSSTPNVAGSRRDILDEMDKRFKEVVKAEFDKDLEYGYKHISTLSGGLDSRTAVAYASKLGYKDINCFTYSESNYNDEKIAKQICHDKHYGFIFHALDNGDYLVKNVDKIISSNDGLVLYPGSAHLYNTINKLALHDFGLIHTGMMGNTVMGCFVIDTKHSLEPLQLVRRAAYSTRLFDKFKSMLSDNFNKYENDELFAFYECVINSHYNGFRIVEQHTESVSPFLHQDFFGYMVKIPPQYRWREALYPDWIKTYLPEFSNYTWEMYGLAPKYPMLLLEIFGKLRNLAIYVTKLNQKYYSMNPFNFWWTTNSLLRDRVNLLFEQNIDLLGKHKELLQDCNQLFKEGSFLEKAQVITLVKSKSLLGLE